MKIVHVSALASGGAVRAAGRLHNALQRARHESMLFYGRPGASPELAGITFEPSERIVPTLSRRFRRKLIQRDFAPYEARRPPNSDAFWDDRSEHGSAPLDQLPIADIIHLHWTSGLVDWQKFLPAAARRAPLVWTLHDMLPLTGGCYANFGCDHFEKECGACPRLVSSDPNDLSHQIWQRKHKALEQVPRDRLTLVATSRWMADAAARSSLMREFPIHRIPLGLDESVFRPLDQAASRAVLGIPADAKVVLFGADWLLVKNKGLSEVVEALGGLVAQIPNLLLVTMGRGADHWKTDAVAHLPLRYVADNRSLAAAYSAADVLVCASRQESFGQSVLESLACGTPVMAYEVGGIPDTVRHEQTGLLAQPGDVAGLREGIRRILMDPELNHRLGERGRQMVVEEFTVEQMGREHVALYESLLGRKPNALPVASPSGLHIPSPGTPGEG